MSCFNLVRDPADQKKAFEDKEFMRWFNRYNPDWHGNCSRRNVTEIWHAYTYGPKCGAVNKGEKTFAMSQEQDESAASLADEAFISWMVKYEPGWRVEFWDRNIVMMYHAFCAKGKTVRLKEDVKHERRVRMAQIKSELIDFIATKIAPEHPDLTVVELASVFQELAQDQLGQEINGDS